MAMTPGKHAANLRKTGGLQPATGGGLQTPGRGRLASGASRVAGVGAKPPIALPGGDPRLATKPLARPMPPNAGTGGGAPGIPAGGADIQSMIAEMKGKLGMPPDAGFPGGGAGSPALATKPLAIGPGAGNQPGGPAGFSFGGAGAPFAGPAQNAVKAALLPRYQQAVAEGKFTQGGAANRQAMFQRGELPGQVGQGSVIPGQGQIGGGAEGGNQFSARPMPLPAPESPPPGQMESITGPGLQAPGIGAPGGGQVSDAFNGARGALQNLTGPGLRGDGGGMGAGAGGETPGFVTGGGLQGVPPAAPNAGDGGDMFAGYPVGNPGPDGRGGNYGAPTFAPGYQTPNMQQRYQDLLQRRMQMAQGGSPGMSQAQMFGR